MSVIINNVDINMFWGKTSPYKSLIKHMIDTGCTVTVLLSKGSLHPVLEYLAHTLYLTTDEVIYTVSYLAALHDIGKCHPTFQEIKKETAISKYIIQNDLSWKGKFPGIFRHEQYSAAIIRRIFISKNRATRKTTRYISNVLGLHHQRKYGRAIEV